MSSLCTKCGYPVRPPEPAYKIKLDTSDPDVRRVFECVKRTAAEVAKWPSWKANECRCPADTSPALADGGGS